MLRRASGAGTPRTEGGNREKHWLRGIVVALVCAAVAFGVLAVISEAEAASCRCVNFYSPVRCSDGKVYQNQCWATCLGATGCVPIGPPLP